MACGSVRPGPSASSPSGGGKLRSLRSRTGRPLESRSAAWIRPGRTSESAAPAAGNARLAECRRREVGRRWRCMGRGRRKILARSPNPAGLDAIGKASGFRRPGGCAGSTKIRLRAPSADGPEACAPRRPLRRPGCCRRGWRIAGRLRALVSSRSAGCGISLGLSRADSRARSQATQSGDRDTQIVSIHGVSSFLLMSQFLPGNGLTAKAAFARLRSRLPRTRSDDHRRQA